MRHPPNGETPEVPDSLWDRAYDSLIQDEAELVEKYEALLDRVLNSEDDGDPSNGTDEGPETTCQPTFDRQARRAKMGAVIEQGQKAVDDLRARYLIDPWAGIAKITEFAMWANSLIDVVVKASPEASIAWVGVSLLLTLLKNPQTAEEANSDGFVEGKATKQLEQQMQGQIVDLYKKIIDVQVRTALRFYRSRHKNYGRDLIIIDLESQQRLKSLDDTASKTQEIMTQYLSIVSKQLGVATRHMEIAMKDQKDRLSNEEMKCLQAFRLVSKDSNVSYEWYRDRFEDRAEGTCNRFLKQKKLDSWLDTDSGS
ncbi:hypothetical protein EDB80DRAFT_893710 [Ilyonectria destructans]|nr:hypothetical protein EDB80DRAFT_893710 [Ilyonectria destructans]